jgi:hypothetical protein
MKKYKLDARMICLQFLNKIKYIGTVTNNIKMLWDFDCFSAFNSALGITAMMEHKFFLSLGVKQLNIRAMNVCFLLSLSTPKTMALVKLL